MDELKMKFNIRNIFKYMLFLFAFVCAGFVINSSNVEAAEIAFGSLDNASKKVSFTVTWSVASPKTISYDFDGGNAGSLGVNDYVSGGNGSATYEVDVSSLTALSENGSYSDSKNRSFTMNVTVKSTAFGAKYYGSNTFTYSPSAPTISSVLVGTTNSVAKIGDTISFEVWMSESVFVNSGVGISFNIGSVPKTANSCDSWLYASSNVIKCSYTVLEGDNGSISNVKVTGATNIKGRFDNAISTSDISVTVGYSDDKVFSVDGVKPKISSISADEGLFSSNKTIPLTISFSEKLKNKQEYGATKVYVKFGSKEDQRECNFSSNIDDTNIKYDCVVREDDSGEMTLVRIDGWSELKGEDGNVIDISGYDGNQFSKTLANNGEPIIDKLEFSVSDCSLINGVNYCRAGSKLEVTFSFNMNVVLDSSNRNIVFYFANVSGKGNYSYTPISSNSFKVSYLVNEKDDGQISFNYDFYANGVNGKGRNFSTRDDDKKLWNNYCVDNRAPFVENISVYYDGVLVEGNIIYSTINKEVVFKTIINDASQLTLDSSKVYLIDSNGNKINACETCDLKTLSLNIVGNELLIKVLINGNYFVKDLKVKIEREAIKDSFNSSLTNEIVSDLYTIDCRLPSFNVEIDYPEYKGYNNGNNWVLISGNVISFKITSSDKDLKDFCVVSDMGGNCNTYSQLVLNEKYEHMFSENEDGNHIFYVVVRDTAMNTNRVGANFILKNMFSYDHGIGVVSRDHSITVDVSLFDEGSEFKYGWFKKGSKVSFSGANITSKQDNLIIIDGSNDFNGEYKVCINRVSDDVVLCSEYVEFDNKIDKFEVTVSNEWTNGMVSTSVVFNDANTIKCVAIGKDYSTPNCNGGSDSVVVYKTSQAISPLNKYVISENGIYYFYIEDAVGNSNKDNIVAVTVTNIDKKNIEIGVYNGDYGEEYNTNLELDSYKQSFNFLVTFDKDNIVGSPHTLYKYFFTTSSYSITNKDSFNGYYLKNELRFETTSCTSKKLNIITPNKNGIYNLYIMAIDAAGNVSFNEVNNIMVDVKGPTIKKYDSNNSETNSVGSNNYIVDFNYSFVIEDYESKLDLNNVYYNWIDSNNVKVFAESKKYDRCPFDYNMCRINGEHIEFGKGLFDPENNYRFELEVYDNAGNVSKFVSSIFKIDTTVPFITSTIDESKWYNVNNVTFTVSKENNSGTLDEMAFCLNDCLTEEDYDLSKFSNLTVNNPTKETKTINLNLIDGINNLYLYARDVFGNSNYVKYVVKYDESLSNIVINNALNGIIDLSNQENNVIDISVSDNVSGIEKYCVYLNEDNKDCINVNDFSVNNKYNVLVNGRYTVEVYDNAQNKNITTFTVVGIDTDPISFDLSSSVSEGNFTNEDIIISVINMRKLMVENVKERVSKISYVALPYDSVISDYESAFAGSVFEIYNSSIDLSLVTKFSVSENGLYLVRIIDTADNVSYNYIKINMIDRVEPFIDTNKDSIGNDKIYVSTSSGNNIYTVDDGENKIYTYSNETMKVYFSANSLIDEYTGFNNYLGLRICFEDVTCVYNTYNLSYTINEGKLVNTLAQISAPYNFSGNIRYYLIDGAGNRSNEYSFKVKYQDTVSDINIDLKDSDSNPIVSSNKYNKIMVSLSGENIDDIINNGGVKYVLKTTNINMNNEFANRQNINDFLYSQGFNDVDSNNIEVSLNSVDSTYYLWVFVKDLLNNYKLFRADELVRIDTIAPSFGEIDLSVDMIDSSNYDLEVGNMLDGYKLALKKSSEGDYEDVILTNNKYSFTVSGVSHIYLKLEDSAGNVTSDSFSLSSVVADPYIKVYQVNNELKADVVIYNLGSKTVKEFKYILVDINSNEIFNENSVNDSYGSCEDYSGTTCVGQTKTKMSNNVYRISLSEDKRVIFYVYDDTGLIKDIDGNLVEANIFVDVDAPVISFDSNNPSVISTLNNSYTFNLNITDDNPSNNNKYILSRNNISLSSFNSYYDSCSNSNDCVSGAFVDSIFLDSGSSELNNLISGNYYLYIYSVDEFGNVGFNKSVVIEVDNDSPVISYSQKDSSNTYNNYQVINSEVFAGGAVKVRFNDDNLNYFEIYQNEAFSRCYVSSTVNDQNCVKDGVGEIGFVKDDDFVYYYLDNGSYRIIAYDSVSNSKEVNLNIDSNVPVINLYKYVAGDYEMQIVSKKVYNSLNDLYINVVDNNFNYLTIDLENTITGDVVSTVARYSYNSEIGNCLADSNVCLYGKDLKSLLSNNTSSYNKIIVKAYDKANRYASVEILYDDVKPIIWTMSPSESLYIDGVVYTIGNNMNVDVEIGVNKGLNLDNLLSKIILDVDGYNYSEVKNKENFSLTIYKESNLFEGNLFETVGEYSLNIDYRDDAGNIANTKNIKINVSDNVNPTLEILDVDDLIEIKTDTVINGVKFSDNYGVEKDGDTIIKEKILNLEDAVCNIIINNGSANCSGNIIKVSESTYKFIIAGTYTFEYNVVDLSGNASSIIQTVKVSDNSGPVMNSSDSISRVIEIDNRNNDGSINVGSIVINYPSSYDNGDEASKTVEYVGLFSINKMGEKYKVEDDYKVSDDGVSITYRFDKVGVYYLRFTSSDKSGNISLFEYEVKVVDKIAPSIIGLDNEKVVSLDLDETFSMDAILSKYEVKVLDNYDNDVALHYAINSGSAHTYEVVLNASDASNNTTSIIVYIDIIDTVAPVSGDLVVASSTNSNNLEFNIIGGEDNSNNFKHMYKVLNEWMVFEEGSTLIFGNDLSREVQVCIKAVDFAGNESEEKCEMVLVDTKLPSINGVKDGDIIESSVTINVSDDRLTGVQVLFNGELLDLDISKLPFELSEIGTYSVIATDELGNKNIVNFMINIDSYVDVVNDLNSSDYTVTSVEFDRRALVKAEVLYDNNGDSNINVDLTSFDLKENDMIYVLGVVPNTTNKFVMFSSSGAELASYNENVNLISYGSVIKEGVSNEDYFLKLNEGYYVYVIVKEEVKTEVVVGEQQEQENEESSSFVKVGLIVCGAGVVLILGYQLLKFRKKVRAA